MIDFAEIVTIIQDNGVRIHHVQVTRMQGLVVGEGDEARVTETHPISEPEMVEIITMTMDRLDGLLQRRCADHAQAIAAELRKEAAGG